MPCFNEQASIANLINSINNLSFPGVHFLPLPVNDASSDDTLSEIKKITETYVNLPENLGIGGAVQCGLKYALENNFDIAVQLDGDGQHPPSELFKVITPIINDEADVSIGSRFINKEGFQSSFLRRLGINILSGLIKFRSGETILDCTSGYRAFNKKAIELSASYYPKKYPEPESTLYFIKKGLRVKETPVIMEARDAGVSSISGWRGIYYMIKVSLAILFLRTK